MKAVLYQKVLQSKAKRKCQTRYLEVQVVVIYVGHTALTKLHAAQSATQDAPLLKRGKHSLQSFLG